MSKNSNELHDKIGARWAALLRRHYRRDAAKRIARDFGCEVRTAQSWLCGQTPRLWHFTRAAQVFGLADALGVIFPDSDLQKTTQLHDDLLRLRSQLDRLSDELGGLSTNVKNDTDDKGTKSGG